MRFLADLVNCRVLMPSALLEFYDKLLAATLEENITQVVTTYRGLCFFFIVASRGRFSVGFSKVKNNRAERIY